MSGDQQSDPLVDGLSPPLPRGPYFDSTTGAWILSRYSEVLAAFLDSRLWPVSSTGEDQGNARDENGSLLQRHEVRDSLSTAKLTEWMQEMSSVADAILARLPAGGTTELLIDFAKPCCMSLALAVTGTNPVDREQLAVLGDHVFAGSGHPKGSPPKLRAADAVAELTRYFERCPVPMAQPTFVGISQTLPRLMVNGWLALFREPSEVARLRAEPELMPRAVEELMRFGGLIPKLYRKARTDAEIAGIRLAAGDRITLMIASANRDSEKFTDPERLDVSRHAAGQLALGIGPSSCAGVRLVRQADGVAIAALLKAFRQITVTHVARWHTGSGFHWPTSVQVRLERHLTAINPPLSTG